MSYFLKISHSFLVKSSHSQFTNHKNSNPNQRRAPPFSDESTTLLGLKSQRMEDSDVSQSKVPVHDLDASKSDEEGFVEVSEDKNATAVTKRGTKKLTSKVWKYFEKVVVNGSKMAKCKRCRKLLSNKDGQGISHLKRHTEQSCPMRPLENGQTKLRTRMEDDGTAILEVKEKYEFDQELSRSKLVNMIIVHEYPLSMVDHTCFRDFIKSINPSFRMISRNTLRGDIMNTFNNEKIAVKKLLEFNGSRIAVTTDMWTASNQKKGYMVVTSHFIDHNWVLRNRILRFCFVPCPHTKGVIAKVLMDCLSQYGLEGKISSVVVDNCTTNDAMMKILLQQFEKKFLICDGIFLHLRCSAHILNLIVKDGLDEIESGILKLRNCVAFWTSTPKRVEKFEETCKYLGCNQTKRLVLDCKTRWNSTFHMLLSALPYKDVFFRLKRLNRKMKFDIPSEDDWKMAEIVCEKLEIFNTITKVFSGRNYPTSNLFFRKACEIKLALKDWLSDDAEIVRSMASKMIEKFDKYWEQINGILAIAAILDPRNKMDCVEYYFDMIYGNRSEKEVEKVRCLLDDLIAEYQEKAEGSNTSDKMSKGKGKRMHSISQGEGEEDRYAKMKKTKKRKVFVKGEVDHYLEDDTIAEDPSFDILGWWKCDVRYPTLRKIAKDILAIPISSVASESAFSMGGRVVSAHRSRLHAETVEALMCLQNWKMQGLEGDLQGTNACSTVNEDSDLEGDNIDMIDMDVDDVLEEDMEDELTPGELILSW